MRNGNGNYVVYEVGGLKKDDKSFLKPELAVGYAMSAVADAAKNGVDKIMAVYNRYTGREIYRTPQPRR